MKETLKRYWLTYIELAAFFGTVCLIAIMGYLFCFVGLRNDEIVNCLAAQKQAIDYPDQFFATKLFYQNCLDLNIEINTIDLR